MLLIPESLLEQSLCDLTLQQGSSGGGPSGVVLLRDLYGRMPKKDFKVIQTKTGLEKPSLVHNPYTESWRSAPEMKQLQLPNSDSHTSQCEHLRLSRNQLRKRCLHKSPGTNLAIPEKLATSKDRLW